MPMLLHKIMLDMNIGKRIREERIALGMKQLELASKVGIKQPTLSALEKGSSTQTAYIGSFASALGVNALWLETGRGLKRPGDLSKKEQAADVPVQHSEISKLLEYYWLSSSSGRKIILESAAEAPKISDAHDGIANNKF